MEYTVSKVTADGDKRLIKDFVHDHFVPDMPLILACGMENSPSPHYPEHRDPHEDFTMKAVDSQGQIIGVAINMVNPSFVADSRDPPEVKDMVDFMHYIGKEAGLHKLPERNMELRVLSVRRDWRGRGVAKRLAEESMKEAHNAGFKVMRICCTSEYTARIARSLGWREYYRLAVKDYPKLSGNKVTLKPVPPHDYVYYYVTYL